MRRRSRAEPGSEADAFERGQKAGEVEGRLTGAEEHLARINGSTDRLALAVELLIASVAKLADVPIVLQELRDAVATLVSDVRTLNEDQGRRDTAVTAKAEAMEERTESRKVELEGVADALARSEQQSTRKWTRNQQVAAIVFGAVGILFSGVGLYLAVRHG